jgi:hypothetical protein
MQKMRERMERAKNANSVFSYKGKRTAVYNPDSLSLVQRARIEAEEIMTKSGTGALFQVYLQLAERYKSLIVLLPVAHQITANVTTAKVLKELERIKLIVMDETKTFMYLLPHPFGITKGEGHADVAEMFQSDAEQTLKNIREMLTYSLHLIQTAQQQMKAEQNSEYLRNIIAGWTRLKQQLSNPSMADAEIEAAKLNIPHNNADKLIVDDERVYNHVTSVYNRQIANNNNAYDEHQKWKRELLMTLGEDDAGTGGGTRVTV